MVIIFQATTMLVWWEIFTNQRPYFEPEILLFIKNCYMISNWQKIKCINTKMSREISTLTRHWISCFKKRRPFLKCNSKYQSLMIAWCSQQKPTKEMIVIIAVWLCKVESVSCGRVSSVCAGVLCSRPGDDALKYFALQGLPTCLLEPALIWMCR